MSYKKTYFSSILVVISIIALTLVTAASFNHNYTAFAASKTKTGSIANHASSSSTTKSASSKTGGKSVSSSATPTITNPKALTKKELNSFIRCINTANISQGLTHKVVTNCLDTVRGITPTTTSGGASTAPTTTSLPSSKPVSPSSLGLITPPSETAPTSQGSLSGLP